MKKRFFGFFLVFLVLFVFFTSAVGASAALLSDDEDLLTSGEEAVISQNLEQLSQKYGMDFVIVTSFDFDGKSAQDFADDYFDYGGFEEDGIILVLSHNVGEVFISTTGDGIKSFSDHDVDLMFDAILDTLYDGEYAKAFEEFLAECERLYDDPESVKDPPFLSTTRIIICIVIGIIVGLIGVNTMKSEMKTVRSKTNAREYMVSDSLELTEKNDTFLFRSVSRVKRQSDSSQGGNRTSSSGRSHGGSGRSFR